MILDSVDQNGSMPYAETHWFANDPKFDVTYQRHKLFGLIQQTQTLIVGGTETDEVEFTFSELNIRDVYRIFVLGFRNDGFISQKYRRPYDISTSLNPMFASQGYLSVNSVECRHEWRDGSGSIDDLGVITRPNSKREIKIGFGYGSDIHISLIAIQKIFTEIDPEFPMSRYFREISPPTLVAHWFGTDYDREYFSSCQWLTLVGQSSTHNEWQEHVGTFTISNKKISANISVNGNIWVGEKTYPEILAKPTFEDGNWGYTDKDIYSGLRRDSLVIIPQVDPTKKSYIYATFSGLDRDAMYRIFVVAIGTNESKVSQSVSIYGSGDTDRRNINMYARSGYMACNHVECSVSDSYTHINDFGIFIRPSQNGGNISVVITQNIEDEKLSDMHLSFVAIQRIVGLYN